jgi:SAM-dependent methyltransferase
MDRLTEKNYWNSVYEKETGIFEEPPSSQPTNGSGWKAWLKRYLGEYWRDYSEYLEWDVIYDKYFPKQGGLKIIELGSAPGLNLIRLHRTFSYEPFGVEYTDAGAKINRTVFQKNGIDPNNVIQADVFSEEFLTMYNGNFDLVISRGFIEHFTEMDKVIDVHLTLLKENGLLMISIPRVRAVPWLLFKIFNPTSIPLHNLTIMNKQPFRALFQHKALQELYCRYHGTLKVQVCSELTATGAKLSLLHLMMDIQSILYMFFRLVLGKRGFETYLFSPFLMYIGKKKST